MRDPLQSCLECIPDCLEFTPPTSVPSVLYCGHFVFCEREVTGRVAARRETAEKWQVRGRVPAARGLTRTLRGHPFARDGSGTSWSCDAWWVVRARGIKCPEYLFMENYNTDILRYM